MLIIFICDLYNIYCNDYLMVVICEFKYMYLVYLILILLFYFGYIDCLLFYCFMDIGFVVFFDIVEFINII